MATKNHSIAVLNPQATSGLLHLAIATEDRSADLGVIWRFQDRDNYWCCHLDLEQLYSENS